MTTKIEANDFPALWASYVNQGSVDGVVGLYNQDFILLPTFSSDIISTDEKLNAYFNGLAQRKGLAVVLHEDTIVTQQCGEKSYINTGFYDFKFEVDGVLKSFPSRFTFVIDLSKEKPLLHHHSSVIPQ